MVVWFRHGPCTVGLEDGVVRAKDFAALTSLLAAADTVEGERERLLAEATQETLRLREAAQAEIDATLAMAREELERGYSDGLERGRQDAAAQWAETVLRDAGSTRRGLERQSERLSQIVSLAVERVVEPEDRQALYRRALRTVTKLLKDVPMLTLRVPETDRDSAQHAVDAVMQHLSGTLPIEVVCDAALPEGSCLFESDQGVIDASLDTQLAAIKRAVLRAAQHMNSDAEVSQQDGGDPLAGDGFDDPAMLEEATTDH